MSASNDDFIPKKGATRGQTNSKTPHFSKYSRKTVPAKSGNKMFVEYNKAVKAQVDVTLALVPPTHTTTKTILEAESAPVCRAAASCLQCNQQ